MAYDLALDANGDLVISGHRDLSGISGTHLTEQRMRIRLQIPRGTWLYDADKTLGSLLHRSIGGHPSQAYSLPSVAREALRPMDDIQVGDVEVVTEEKVAGEIVDKRHKPGLRIYYQPMREGDPNPEQAEFVADIPLTLGVD